MRPTFAVCQLGARMHYAVPRLLASAEMLERLFTDICAAKGWPRWLNAIPEAWCRPGIRRLLGRVPHGVAPDRITAFHYFGLQYARRRARARTPAESVAVHLWAGTRFCELIIGAGLGAAAGVYAFNTAGLELLTWARQRGLKTALEQTIAPSEVETRLLDREFAAHPDWEPAAGEKGRLDELAQRERAEWECADVILCGSEFVRQGIAECRGPHERCVVVPYGVEADETAAERPAHDGPLRVLTVGAVGLRKGSPYVVAAAQALGERAIFRMAGSSSSLSAPALQRLHTSVQALGSVPRSEMARHYAWADVFLLPSICEGSATATYEALAAGLPVIATPHTGAHLTEGASGFTVPVGNVDAIVEKLMLLSTNRALLAEMSLLARQEARKLTLPLYGRRLTEVLDRLVT